MKLLAQGHEVAGEGAQGNGEFVLLLHEALHADKLLGLQLLGVATAQQLGHLHAHLAQVLGGHVHFLLHALNVLLRLELGLAVAFVQILNGVLVGDSTVPGRFENQLLAVVWPVIVVAWKAKVAH